MKSKRGKLSLILGLGVLFLQIGAGQTLAQSKSLSQLVAELKNKPMEQEGLPIAEEIAKLTPANEAEVEALLELIQQRKGTVRENIINSIARIEDTKLGAMFIQKLEHSHPMVQAVAAGMCGKLKLVAAEQKLIRLIRQSTPVMGFADEDHERATVTAIVALGELGQESSLELLVSLVGKMKGYEIRALRKYGVKPLAALLGILNNPDATSNARASAVQVILALEDKAAIPLLQQEVAKKGSRARPYAITAILKIAPEEMLPHFIALWEKEPDPVLEMRLLTFINSWRLGDSRQTPFLVKVLQTSTDSSLRCMAVTCLSRIKSDVSLAALKQAAKDKDKMVSLYATKALEIHFPGEVEAK